VRSVVRDIIALAETRYMHTPEVDIKDVNVVSPKSLEALADAESHAFEMIAHRVDLLIWTVVEARVLGREDNLVPIPPLLHPLAHPFFTLSFMVKVGNIDEIASSFEESVEKGKSLFLCDLTGVAWTRRPRSMSVS
jgi:hypothetical protein